MSDLHEMAREVLANGDAFVDWGESVIRDLDAALTESEAQQRAERSALVSEIEAHAETKRNRDRIFDDFHASQLEVSSLREALVKADDLLDHHDQYDGCLGCEMAKIRPYAPYTAPDAYRSARAALVDKGATHD